MRAATSGVIVAGEVAFAEGSQIVFHRLTAIPYRMSEEAQGQ